MLLAGFAHGAERLPLASITIEPPKDWNWSTKESIRPAVVGPKEPEA
jgi:hypothetical protein